MSNRDEDFKRLEMIPHSAATGGGEENKDTTMFRFLHRGGSSDHWSQRKGARWFKKPKTCSLEKFAKLQEH